MPNLDFYALGDDEREVREVAFGLGCFRVFEAYSEFDKPLREFSSADDVPPELRFLVLHPAEAGPDPVHRRFDLYPDLCDGATFRYVCEGWGLIHLRFGLVYQPTGELRWSHTNHNSAARAANWAGTYPHLGDPDDWDWRAVSRASRRFTNAIRRLAVDKIGSHPVLPAAARYISEHDLRYEAGTGLHRQPPGLAPVRDDKAAGTAP